MLTSSPRVSPLAPEPYLLLQPLCFYLSEPASNPLSPEKHPLVYMVPCSFWALKHWDHAACLPLILTPIDLGSSEGEPFHLPGAPGKQNSPFGVGEAR